MRYYDQNVLFGLVQVEEEGGDLIRSGTVEAAGRLIAEEEPGAVDQRSRHCHALSLAAGEFGRTVVEAMGKSNAVDEVQCSCTGIAVGMLEGQGGDQYVFQNRVLRQKVVFLKDKSDYPISKAGEFGFGQGKRVFAVDFDLSRRWAIQCSD